MCYGWDRTMAKSKKEIFLSWLHFQPLYALTGNKVQQLQSAESP